ncbi:MAG: alginate export family protein [Chitinophagaceae bacterium]
MTIRWVNRLCLLCLMPVLPVVWNTTQAQSFRLMRYDDAIVKSDSVRSFYRDLKYLPLNRSHSVYLSAGGEIRYEYSSMVNQDWQSDGEGRNHSFFQRYVFFTNLQLGSRVRVFAQVNSALEDGNKMGPAPVDEDKLVIENLFIDIGIDKKKSLTARIGRQELDYGTGRLISVREGTNVRLYFTGAKLIYTKGNWQVDGFAMMADSVYPGVLDNKSTHQLNLWGLYSRVAIPRSGNIDLYYLGIKRENARFEEGIKDEKRHTLAVRYWKYGGGFIYNAEAAWQFGKFGDGNINAWTFALEMGYLFDKLRWKPSVNLRNDYISGDRKKGDGNLQTFNPIYPKGGYFGFNPRVGPVNLIDLHPYCTLSPTSKLEIQGDVVFNWRMSAEDGVYRPSGTLNLKGAGVSKKYIGTAYLLSGSYQVNKHLSFSCGAQFFKTGGFVKEVIYPSANSGFFNAQATFKF